MIFLKYLNYVCNNELVVLCLIVFERLFKGHLVMKWAFVIG